MNESFYNDIIKYGGKVGPTECTTALWVLFFHPEQSIGVFLAVHADCRQLYV